MWLFVWESEPSKIYLWNAEVSEVYQWSTKIWPSATPVQTIWAYWNKNLWLISVVYRITNWAPDTQYTYTFADKNLWATTVWNYGDTVTAANAWNFYQWWNNYGFPYNSTLTTSSTLVDSSNYWPWNYYSSSTFIRVPSTGSQTWEITPNLDLWWNQTSTNDARRWPCPTGFHIMSPWELTMFTYLWSSSSIWWWTSSSWWDIIQKCLLLPWAWYYNQDWQFVTTGNIWAIWTSGSYSGDSTQWYNLYIMSTIWQSAYSPKWRWYAIRPLKNTPVLPDSSWTKLYPTS